MISKLTQPVVIALIVLAAVALGCATFLIANGNVVPAELWAVPFAALTGATGIAVPSGGTSSTSTQASSGGAGAGTAPAPPQTLTP